MYIISYSELQIIKELKEGKIYIYTRHVSKKKRIILHW